MPFEKNISGNPKGKPKGAVNKTTREIKEIITKFLSNNIEKIETDYHKLDPKDKFMVLDKMLKFVIPTKVEETELTKYPTKFIVNIKKKDNENIDDD